MKKYWQDKNIILWIISSFICVGGDVFTTTAIPLLIYNITHSARMAVFVYLLDILPEVILAPLAGVVVDSYDKKKIIVYANILAGCILCLAIVYDNCWFYIFSNSILSIANLFYATAAKTTLPFLVKNEEDFSRVNSFISLVLKIARIMGAATATMLLALMDVKYLLLFDAVSFLITAFLVNNITFNNESTNLIVSALDSKVKIRQYWESLIESYNFLRVNNEFVIFSLYYALVIGIETVLGAQLVVFLEKDLSLPNYYYGIYKNFVLVGIFLAQVVFSKIILFGKEHVGIISGLLLSAIEIIILAFTGKLYLGIFLGFCDSMVMNCWYGLYYRVIPAAHLGRIISFCSVVFALVRLCVTGIICISCTHVSTRHLFAATGVIIALTVIASMAWRNIMAWSRTRI